ncbi:MAG: pseudouridine synthase [Pseudomonadota bacterium]
MFLALCMPVILLNKPFRVLSQFTDSAGRTTLSDLLQIPAIRPAGRLDFDSEGLLLLTDDGRLQHAIAHPHRKLKKVYWVQVEGQPSRAALEQLTRGVVSRGETLHAVSATRLTRPTLWERHPPIRERRSVADDWLEITLTEGKNRQVRRMTAAVGLPTLRLVRTRIGPFRLRGLQPGEYTTLDTHFAWQQLTKDTR